MPYKEIGVLQSVRKQSFWSSYDSVLDLQASGLHSISHGISICLIYKKV